MHTRRDYMEGRCSHSAYYEEVAKRLYAKGLLHLPPAISNERVLDALKRGDLHLNSIPLSEWDGAAIPYTRLAAAHRVFAEFDDWTSLANYVCALKEWARMRARAHLGNDELWAIIQVEANKNAEQARKLAMEAKRRANG